MEHLPKKIHQNGISYTLVGDYYIPDLRLPEESRPIGRWGRMHKAFLQEHRTGQYNALLLSGKLWTYLAAQNLENRMTGCKGYGIRGSDARTEIERTKEADTPGEIPGRSGLQADRRTGNKFIMRGAWLRSKETEEIIITLIMKEKKILYAYGCPSHHNTVTRLKWLTALTVDPEAKRQMLGLARKVETEVDG